MTGISDYTSMTVICDYTSMTGISDFTSVTGINEYPMNYEPIKGENMGVVDNLSTKLWQANKANTRMLEMVFYEAYALSQVLLQMYYTGPPLDDKLISSHCN